MFQLRLENSFPNTLKSSPIVSTGSHACGLEVNRINSPLRKMPLKNIWVTVKLQYLMKAKLLSTTQLLPAMNVVITVEYNSIVSLMWIT